MEFPGVSKKYRLKFLGVNQKRSGISNGDEEKTMWNFQGSLYLTLEFPRDLTKICASSGDGVLLDFSEVKQKNETFQRGFQKSVS